MQCLYSFATVSRTFRSSTAHSRRKARASLLYWPCFQAPLALPLGAPPRAPWNRHTLQPRTAGARHWHRDRLLMAEQRGAAFIRCTRFMGLPSVFAGAPTPLADVADDGLATFVDGDVLHLDGLLTAGAVFLERTRDLMATIERDRMHCARVRVGHHLARLVNPLLNPNASGCIQNRRKDWRCSPVFRRGPLAGAPSCWRAKA